MKKASLHKTEKERIKWAIDYAWQHPVRNKELQLLNGTQNGREIPLDLAERIVVDIRGKYAVYLTVEEHPVGWLRHLAIGLRFGWPVPVPFLLSEPLFVRLVLEFGMVESEQETAEGMRRGLELVDAWHYRTANGAFIVNLLQAMTGIEVARLNNEVMGVAV